MMRNGAVMMRRRSWEQVEMARGAGRGRAGERAGVADALVAATTAAIAAARNPRYSSAFKVVPW